ncbi:hypothetical protein PV10_04512 [Exophiala mesophila]|uniref:Very-long-chain (3R)-3-hydroxyacyl-CoA dehydratase n=1 Tax=Exophiala mesophila TaxID=212818 RepID=A0A0D1XYF2_EXOME|nr:uncharacterized protein PV10_04512 [Exophiala mesophila]KIV93286.1 hypothetical protein PV10_04512 [Exophiala mesophila]
MATTKNQPGGPRTSSSPTQRYLIAYNGVCFVLWSIVILRALVLIPVLASHGKLHSIFDALFTFLKWTQTIALLEIVHAALGLVRASPITTAMQVSSRILVVWIVLQLFPQIVATTTPLGKPVAGSTTGPLAFCGILLAWGVTEVIRYGFFVWKTVISDQIPSWLTWLRYNTFFVLYPMGISSECLLMYLALAPAEKQGKNVDSLLKIVLIIYIPGSYILYTHMMSQRRKVLKGKTKSS